MPFALLSALFLWDSKLCHLSLIMRHCNLQLRAISFAYAKIGPQTARCRRVRTGNGGWIDEPASISLLSLCWPMRRGGT